MIVGRGATGDENGVEVWDLASGKLVETHAPPFAALPDLRHVVAAGPKGELSIFDLASGSQRQVGAMTDRFTTASASPTAASSRS